MRTFMVSLFSALVLTTGALANANPPEALSASSFAAWAGSLGAASSPYFENIFAWYEQEKDRALPAIVTAQPDATLVVTDGPMQECIRKEEAGEVEEGITYGSELYSKINAPIETVLETILYRWGKPVGQKQGTTYPMDTVYSYRQEKLEERYGAGAYYSVEAKKGGGFAKEVNDEYMLLVRGDAVRGYDLVGQFVRPAGATTTKSAIMVMMIRPRPDGGTDFKGNAWLTGQSYAFLGNVGVGRRNFGFSAERVRGGQRDFLRMVAELKSTGTIRDRR